MWSKQHHEWSQCNANNSGGADDGKPPRLCTEHKELHVEKVFERQTGPRDSWCKTTFCSLKIAQLLWIHPFSHLDPMPRTHALNQQTQAQSLVLYKQDRVVCADLTLGMQDENTMAGGKHSKNQQLAKSSETVNWKCTDMHLFCMFSADNNGHI